MHLGWIMDWDPEDSRYRASLCIPSTLSHELSMTTRGKLRTGWFYLYDILEKARLWSQSKVQWLPRAGGVGEGGIGRAQIFLGPWKYSAWYHVIICLSKPIGCTTPSVNHNVNCGLQVIMMHQCRFINHSMGTTLAGSVGNEGDNAYMEGIQRQSLYRPLNLS